MSLRSFRVGPRTLLLVETPEARRRDIRNRTLTVREADGDTIFCFYQGHDFATRIKDLPLSVRIYTSARQVLEAMLRAAIPDAAICMAFEFQPAATPPPPAPEPMRLANLQRPPEPAEGADAVCSYRFAGTTLVVRLTSKEFKLPEARRYAELVFDRLKARVKRLVVDVGEVTYMNSSGISVLARSSAEFPFKIANISEHVRNVMDVMGLLAVIEVYDTAESALAAFGPER